MYKLLKEIDSKEKNDLYFTTTPGKSCIIHILRILHYFMNGKLFIF